MSAPQPQPPTSRPVAVVCAVLVGLLAAVVLTIGAVGFYEWAFSPILPPVESRPIPVSTAGPSPLTVELTAVPHTGWGPRALTAPTSTEISR